MQFSNKMFSAIKEKCLKKILKKVPVTSSMADVLGENKDGNVNNPSLFTYILPFVYGRLFDNDPNKVLSKASIKFRQKVLFNSLRKGASLLLKNKELIIDKKVELNKKTHVIFALNHGFVEDSITPAIITGRSAYFISGNMAMSLNTLFGLLIYLNGAIFLNRRDKSSRKSVIDKAVRALGLGTSLYFYPEGVWNKTSNQLTLKFWPGIANVAYKSQALIVPVIQLPVGNKIYASQLEAFDITEYAEDELYEALEDLRTIFNTELWRLMEKYAKTSRKELIESYNSPTEMYEEHLKSVIGASGTYYDYPIETSSDYRDKNVVRPEDVWEPIAKLEITAHKASHIAYAQNLIDTLKREDYQRRF